MCSMIRPSLILKMNLDERLHSEDVVAEIKRSYTHVAATLVEQHEAAAGYPENSLRFVIKMHQAYWDKNDAAAQERWEGVMPKWLRNMFYKVSNTITASNKVRAEQDKKPLMYQWLELEFGDNLTVAMATAANSGIREDARDLVEQIRDLSAAGVWGEDVACVRVPSRASYAAQLAEVEAAAAAQVEETAEAVEPVAAEEAAEAVEAPAELAQEEAPAEVAEEPAFDADATIWGIEYADGTVREFDSAAGALI